MTNDIGDDVKTPEAETPQEPKEAEVERREVETNLIADPAAVKNALENQLRSFANAQKDQCLIELRAVLDKYGMDLFPSVPEIVVEGTTGLLRVLPSKLTLVDKQP